MIRFAKEGVPEARITKLIERASTEDFVTLGEWFANCYWSLQSRPSQWPHAQLYVDVIKSAWMVRQHTLPPGIERSRPDPGVLKSVGYCVGRNGKRDEIRRTLIDYLMGADALPPIKDQGYMSEWGSSGSAKRFYKGRRAIENFVREYRQVPSHAWAVHNWRADLNYLDAKWGHLAR